MVKPRQGWSRVQVVSTGIVVGVWHRSLSEILACVCAPARHAPAWRKAAVTSMDSWRHRLTLCLNPTRNPTGLYVTRDNARRQSPGGDNGRARSDGRSIVHRNRGMRKCCSITTALVRRPATSIDTSTPIHACAAIRRMKIDNAT